MACWCKLKFPGLHVSGVNLNVQSPGLNMLNKALYYTSIIMHTPVSLYWSWQPDLKIQTQMEVSNHLVQVIITVYGRVSLEHDPSQRQLLLHIWHVWRTCTGYMFRMSKVCNLPVHVHVPRLWFHLSQKRFRVPFCRKNILLLISYVYVQALQIELCQSLPWMCWCECLKPQSMLITLQWSLWFKTYLLQIPSILRLAITYKWHHSDTFNTNIPLF